MIPDVPIKDQRKIVKEIDKANNQLIDSDMKKLAIIDSLML
jgi:hypothetical protein